VSFTVFHLSYTYWKLGSLLFGSVEDSQHLTIVISGGIAAMSFEAAVANIAGYMAGIINSFVWNKFWTFKVRHETTRQLNRFFILNLFCLILSTSIIFIIVDILGAPHKITWIITMGFITILNFVGSKYWVFNKHFAIVLKKS
jgi:putative flippase GtrA